MTQTDCRKKMPQKRGFVLLVVAGLLVILGVVLLKTFPVDSDIMLKKVGKTEDKLKVIKRAILVYYEERGELPCPAVSNTPIDEEEFGKAVADCSTDLVESGVGNVVKQGGVPFKDLGLPAHYAYDDWKRRFTYVMDSSYTGYFGEGDNITINDAAGNEIVAANGNTIPQFMGLIISHGEDGVGAFSQRGGEATPAKACGADANTDHENCNGDNIFIKAPWSDTNDDLVEYLTPCPAAVCGVVLWLDGTNIDGSNNSTLIDGGNVTTWVDKSGNGFDVESINDPRPNTADIKWLADTKHPKFQSAGINSKGTVLFDGTGNDYLTHPTKSDKLLTKSNKLSVLSVVHSTHIEAGQIYLSYSQVGGAWQVGAMTNRVGNSNLASWDGEPNLALPHTLSAPRLRSIIYDGTTNKGYIDAGTPVSAATSPKFSETTSAGVLRQWQYLRVGRSGYGDGPNLPYPHAYLNGHIGEIMVFDSALSDENRQRIQCQMARKWGVFPKNGLTLWLDATNVDGAENATLIDDDDVDYWYDKSASYPGGTDYSASSAFAAVPKFKTDILNVGTMPVVRFDGTHQNYLITDQIPSFRHTFAVFSRSAANQPVVELVPAAYRGLFSNMYRGAADVGYTIYENYSTNSANYIAGSPNSASGSTNYYIVSGKNHRTPENTNTANQVWRIGGSDRGTDRALNGDIAEIIVYNRTLSDEERRITECYLSEKWGVDISANYP